MSSFPLLTALILWPLLGLLVSSLLSKDQTRAQRWLLIGCMGVELVLSCVVLLESTALFRYDTPSSYPNALIERLPWFSLVLPSAQGFTLKAQWLLVADGISAPLVGLSGLLLFLGACGSHIIKDKVKTWVQLYLLLAAAIMGSFLAVDMLLFYVFFEFMLLPMFFLIGYFGGSHREYASMKFFLYTLLGSVLILGGMVAIIWGLGGKDGVYSLDIAELYARTPEIGSLLDYTGSVSLFDKPLRAWVFVLLILGFAIKMPVVPLHTWLPDAHVEAPAPVSVLLAGVLLKIGSYGMMRFVLPVFPDMAYEMGYVLGLMGVVSIVYGAFCALAQTHLKRLVAYSSVSHMGYVLLGLASATSEGYSGALYQMVSHGLISAMLFFLVGQLYERTHDYEIGHYRGLRQYMPRYSGMMMLAIFAGMGLPMLSGFIGEILVLMGAFHSEMSNEILPRWLVIPALFGLLLSAGYFIWMYQRMFFGPGWYKGRSDAEHLLTDITRKEWWLLFPLAVMIVFLGVYPQALISISNYNIEYLLQLINNFQMEIR